MKQHPAPRNHISERSPAAGRMHLPGGYLLTENVVRTRKGAPSRRMPRAGWIPCGDLEAQLTDAPLYGACYDRGDTYMEAKRRRDL